MALTEEKFRKMLFDMAEAILEGIEAMGFAKKEDLMNTENRLNERITQLENKVDVHYKEHKDQINGLKADLADTVTRKEFYSKFN